jgi:hypothetical protein
VFDPEETGIVSFRELLILFSMSMEGTPREKLHWAFRLYDQASPLRMASLSKDNRGHFFVSHLGANFDPEGKSWLPG